MSHFEKKKNRPPVPVKRVKRQSETLERAIERDKARTHVLHPATSSRGTLDGFTAEVTEDRVRKHTVMPPRQERSAHLRRSGSRSRSFTPA